MNDQFSEDAGEEKEQEESFEKLLERYGAGMDDSLMVGDKIEAKIISIGEEAIYLDTGTKVDGVVEKGELLDENGELTYKEGDRVELYIVALSEHEIQLSRALSGIGGLEMLKDAYHGQVPVEGRVAAEQKGGFHVEVLHRRAFCPISQMDVKYVEKPEDYVGKTLEFMVVRLEDNGRNIVLSRRKLLEAKIAEARAEFFAELSEGQIREGVVTKIMPFGVFIELAPGVEGLAHISELGWSRLESPEDAVSLNQKVAAKVIGVQNSEDLQRAKIAVSVKQVEDDPWESLEDKFEVGDKVQGTVSRIVNFGAFVEIFPGIEGLVHISEMSHTRRLAKVEDAVAAGETVDVVIKEMDPAGRRISLSIKEAGVDPWTDVSVKYPIGAKSEGVIVKKESFGFFVELEPGVTGLMPKSKIRESGDSEIDRAKVGDFIQATVVHVDPESRKLTLGPAKEEEVDWRGYQNAEEKPMSDLALKLQKALENKK